MDKKYLVIPDIHGRTYWKDVTVSIDEYEKVIFLGDYLDPYPFEGITVRNAIDNFLEILKFAEKNKEKVILLLGNHDIYYYFKLYGPSRYAYNDHEEIEMIYEDYKDLFKIAFETEQTLFSHSGYLKGWADDVKRFFKLELTPNADVLNDLIKYHKPTDNGVVVEKESLMMVSGQRGGRFAHGSCIWADYHEHLPFYVRDDEKIDKFQVFGHTLQLDLQKYYETSNPDDIADGEPVIEETFAMLDCRHPFVYDDTTHECNMI